MNQQRPTIFPTASRRPAHKRHGCTPTTQIRLAPVPPPPERRKAAMNVAKPLPRTGTSSGVCAIKDMNVRRRRGSSGTPLRLFPRVRSHESVPARQYRHRPLPSGRSTPSTGIDRESCSATPTLLRLTSLSVAKAVARSARRVAGGLDDLAAREIYFTKAFVREVAVQLGRSLHAKAA